MKRMRLALVVFGALLVFGAANVTILKKQSVLDNGHQVLLRLAPVDPRSLMQGDYMRLRYDPTVYPERDVAREAPWRGTVVLALDSDGVGRFSRLDDGTPLRAGEIRISYKLTGRGGSMVYGAGSYFFQEGQARRYANAVYGVLRVDAEGNSVLAGLAGKDRQIIETE